MLRRLVCLACSASLLLLVPLLASARTGVLKTNDGQSFTGDINDNGPDPDSITVTVHGGNISIPRTSVLTIQYDDQFDATFAKNLAALQPRDMPGRMDLARQALAAGKFDLAAQAARSILSFAPNNTAAQDMLAATQAQKNLVTRIQQSNETSPLNPEPSPPANAAPAAAPDQTSGPAGFPATTTAETAKAGKYLTMDDVYAIRRAELLSTDNLRVDFTNNARANYIATSGVESFAYLHESETDQALEILQYGNPRLAANIQVLGDPFALQTFRARILPRFITGCAASGCHGQAASANFFLYPNADDVTHLYTDFYVLQMTSRKLTGGDTFGAGPVVRPMIDRLHPDMSLLIQYALPRAAADLPHPKVIGYKPVFKDNSDPGYVDVRNWILSLKSIVPDYGIDFPIPNGHTPQPSTSAPSDATLAPAPMAPAVPTVVAPHLTLPEPAPATPIAPASATQPSPSYAPVEPSTAPSTRPGSTLME